MLLITIAATFTLFLIESLAPLHLELFELVGAQEKVFDDLEFERGPNQFNYVKSLVNLILTTRV